MNLFSVNSFSGMNNWLHPGLLKENTAVQLTDAEVTDGKLLPQKLPLAIKSNAGQLGFFGGADKSVVKWYDRTYWSFNKAFKAPYYGGVEENLGVNYPEAHPDPVCVSAYGDDGLTGDYKYCWCYVNVNGWESAPCAEDGPLWVDISAEDQYIKITAPEKFPEEIAYIKIYRTADKGGDFYCVGEIHQQGGEFIDKTDDNTLVMLESATSFDNYPPPEKGRYLTESGGVFFLAVGSRVYFSHLGNPHAWPTLNFVGFDDTVTGITAEFQGVLVFTYNNTYRITGADDPATLVKSLLPGNQGCSNYNTVSHVANAPVWLSNDGICLWDGESISIVNQGVIKTQRLIPRFAVSGNDVYYLFTVGRVIVFDRRNGVVFRELSWKNYDFDFGWYDGNADQIYLSKKGEIYEFGNGETGELYYLSPYIGGSEIGLHKFMEFNIFCSEECSVRFIIDDRNIDKKITSPGKTRLKFPFATVGRKMQIQIQTSGMLSEFSVLYE